jgi:PAS domain S-box-containing protein
MTDRNCKIEYANKAAIELYGYSAEELNGKHIGIFDVPGKEIPAESWAILTQTGKWSGDVIRLKKDGSVFYGALSIFTIYDENKKIIGFAGNTKDISKTISATEALIEKQRQLVSIIDNTEDVIASIDIDLKFVEFNQVMANFARSGFNQEIKKGDSIFKSIHPSKHDHFKNIYAEVFIGKRLFDTETFKGPNGNFVYFESSYNPIFNEFGKVIGISIFSKNITEQIKRENELKKAFKEKEILLSEIHHRLKNNLAIISSVLHLQEMNITNEEAIKCLKESRIRIKSAALLHEMLYQNDSIDKLCIKQYLSKMFYDIKNSMGNNEYNLNIHGDDVSLSIHNAIPAGLLFNELFTNSIKHGFSEKGAGEIVINITNKEKNTLFEITESEGVFPDKIDLENSNSTGLTLIKDFTEQLKGDIQLIKTPKTKYILSLDLS